MKIGFNPSRWAWKLPDAKDANPLGALRESKDATPLGALRENPHEKKDSGSSGSVDNVEGSHSSAMALFEQTGRPTLTAQERAALSDQVHRAQLERQDAERAARDARLREQGDEPDLGTGRLDRIGEWYAE